MRGGHSDDFCMGREDLEASTVKQGTSVRHSVPSLSAAARALAEISLAQPHTAIVSKSVEKPIEKADFCLFFQIFLVSGDWICQSGAWNCLLGGWNCLLGAWICLWVSGGRPIAHRLVFGSFCITPPRHYLPPCNGTVHYFWSFGRVI